MPSERWTVGVAPDLGLWLRALKVDALSAPSSAKATMYRALRRVFDQLLTDPVCAMAKNAALKQPLGNVRRIKLGQGNRLRLFYLASPVKQRVVVLFIGFRKSGDQSDAYAEFTTMLNKGAYDAVFAELEIEKPTG